jgi:hypothetical protein
MKKGGSMNRPLRQSFEIFLLGYRLATIG